MVNLLGKKKLLVGSAGPLAIYVNVSINIFYTHITRINEYVFKLTKNILNCCIVPKSLLFYLILEIKPMHELFSSTEHQL